MKSLMFYADHIPVVSKLLNTAGTRSALAKTGKIDENQFALEMVGPVRGTTMLYLCYSGPDSNSVRSIASNAVNLVASFYVTNKPSWEVTFVDSECIK
jgi:hypothetical protein